MKSIQRFLPIFLLVAVCATLTRSQTIPPLSADRPDQTEASSLVPVGYFQAELGVVHETVTTGTTVSSVPGFLLKYGLSRTLEFRLSSDIRSQSAPGVSTSGLSPLAVGMKVWLFDEDGSLPQAAFIGSLSIPRAASSGLTQTFYAPAFRFTASHSLTDILSLGYNLGAAWDGSSAEPVFAYTIVGAVSVTEMIGCFAEVYAFAPQRSAADHRVDGGITWLVTPDVMLDVSGGIGLSAGSPDGFVGAGVSFRFDTR